MYFLNVHRRSKSGHFDGSQRIRKYFLLNHYLPIWIIYFGESPPKWRIIILHGFSGIYGRVETTKFLAIWIWTREILSNWQKRNRYFCLEAQNSQNQGMDHTRLPVPAAIPTIPGRWCFTGSWKNQDIYSGQGWYSTLEGYDGLMGARNTRASQSPLHSEIEALI